ncbi:MULTISPECIES: O-antigen ligase family protein [Psychrilyobacter]|uniref:O-antigen ligase domain-containing protein n=1 Tax=Psychrilyobacter piezotolerans TaxID=2293438 RepID=A0ABX9KKV3_9FUSO|nr:MULTISPECIES: O-antigen ligase family protein [Psychrilyobacter]MCS5421049.1 O-antigen ligase family protein [Psychrilyobacter sp. S5]NDI76328.1 O-antigen ligase family protein [Psychrilyobacter piezotolerans]RDE65926.1 O-antigen ligase domain-containing protein [Psychrilyobacter sp. S5]REI43104.1 O-antigen ligase domain-containing protein [Psychrilyobacter piezotolerans]
MLKKIKLLPLLIILGVVPLIVRLKIIPTPIGSLDYMAYPLGENNFDFFSYYKAIFIVALSTIGLILFFIKGEVVKTKYYIPLIVMGILANLSTVFSPFTSIVLKGVGDRYEGIFVWLSYLVITFLTVNLARTKKDIKILLGAAFAGIIVISIIGSFQFFGLDLFKSALGRHLILPKDLWGIADTLNFKFDKYIIYSTYFNPNYGGSLMVMFLFFAAMTFLSVRGKLYNISAYLFYILIYINWLGCRSRAGFLAGQFTLIFFLFFYRKNLIKKSKKIILLVVTSLIIGWVMDGFSENSLGKKLYDTELSSYNPMREMVLNTPNDLVVTTDKAGLNIIRKDEKLVFKDEDGRTLPSEFVDNRYKFNDNRYEKFEIEKRKEDYYNIVYDKFSYPLILRDNGFKTIGFQGRLTDIYMAERVRWMDGYEFRGSSRVYIWSRTIPKLKQTGFLGGGPDTYSLIFPQEDNFGKRIAFGNPSMIVDKPHNLYLQILINMGYLFFIGFVVFIGTYLIQSIKIYRNREFNSFYEVVGLATALAISGYLAAGMFNDSAVSVAPYFWFFMGLGIGVNKKLEG